MSGEKLTTVVSLSGRIAASPPFKHPPTATIHDESCPGHFRKIFVSSEGLRLVRHHGQRVVTVQIPLAEVISLAEQIEPEFAPYMNATAPLKKL